jgi:hypothetical protein
MASRNDRRLELVDSFERLVKEREGVGSVRDKNVLICCPRDDEVE